MVIRVKTDKGEAILSVSRYFFSPDREDEKRTIAVNEDDGETRILVEPFETVWRKILEARAPVLVAQTPQMPGVIR